MPFACPDCGAFSYHPEDIKNQYCGRCHEFKGEPYEVEVDLLSEVPDPELLVGLEVNVIKKPDGRLRVAPVIPDSPADL